MNGFPEAVAGSAEVVADGDAVKAGVDAAKEHFKVRREDVGHGLAVTGGDLFFGRAFWHEIVGVGLVLDEWGLGDGLGIWLVRALGRLDALLL